MNKKKYEEIVHQSKKTKKILQNPTNGLVISQRVSVPNMAALI